MSNKLIYVHGSNLKSFCHFVIVLLRIVCSLVIVLVSIKLFVLMIDILPTIIEWRNDSIATAQSSSVEDFRNEQTSFIYDEDDNLILKLHGDKDKIYLEYNNIPESAINAFVAIEDKRFWEHNGVDWLSTFKAAVLLITDDGEITRGGSTITQQLARNVFLSFEQSYERKVREIFLALALEKKYSKQQILEFYVNNINFGNGFYGIEAAAEGYFEKSASSLTLGEITFLCAIPNNPSYYNPFNNYSNTIVRKNTILQEMLLQGYVSSEEYKQALFEKPILCEQEKTDYEDYAASYALYCSIIELMRRDGFEFEYKWDSNSDYVTYSESYADEYNKMLQKFKTGGYIVKTSLSLERQNDILSLVSDTFGAVQESIGDSGNDLQTAVTVIDNLSGSVIAVIGGKNEPEVNLSLNRAFQSFKQPASTLKPLIDYTPLFEAGYNPDSMVNDLPIVGGPKNAGSSYKGLITIRSAVECSSNVVAWNVFNELTPDVALSYLTRMKFTKVVPDDYASPTSIGGMTYGANTTEMASAYSCLANYGYWREPTCILYIIDSNGSRFMPTTASEQIYSNDAANYMTDVLSGVAVRGTARGLVLSGGNGFACKTGTSNDNRVAWFCGYTKQFSVAVYVGADDNSVSIKSLSGNTFPERIWKMVQEYLLQGYDALPLIGDNYDTMQGNR